MKNTKPRKTCKNNLQGYPSEKTSWAYWMQALEPNSAEINAAFPGYHPQWVVQSQYKRVSAEGFCYMRKRVLKISQRQCAAYLRVHLKTLSRWEKGEIEVPFMAFELLRMVYRGVHFKLSHPEWDGWFISEAGKLVSPYSRDIELAPGDINLVPYLHNWNATMKDEIAKLTKELAEAKEENTALREIFLVNGVTDEVAAMQERINALMAKINTARVMPFAPANIEQHPQGKVA